MLKMLVKTGYSTAYVLLKVVVYGYRIGMGQMGDRMIKVSVDQPGSPPVEIKSCPLGVTDHETLEDLVAQLNAVTERLNEINQYGMEGRPDAPTTVDELIPAITSAPVSSVPSVRNGAVSGIAAGTRTRPVRTD